MPPGTWRTSIRSCATSSTTRRRRRGGLALTMFGGSSNIAPDSPSAFGQIYIGDDSIIPVLREFSERVHRHGLRHHVPDHAHGGTARCGTWRDWLPPLAPSVVREHAHRSFPKEMDRHDIRRVVRAFGDAAWRCKEGGLDGTELLAHGHLIHQFLDAARQPAHRRVRREPREPGRGSAWRCWRRCVGGSGTTSSSASG